MDIDLILPYVDNKEYNWVETHRTFCLKNNLEYIENPVRFRSWNNLHFLFRGIEKNMPWIRNVYLIVSSMEQVPEWVNSNNVKIVLHRDIIPPKFLPTFNSTTIEMFLKNIVGLSEYFLYANDDTFPILPLSPTDFFDKNGNPVLSVSKKEKNLSSQFRRVEWNCQSIVQQDTCFKIPDKTMYKIAHNIIPMRKTTLIEVYKRHKKEIENSISPFREAKNLNQYIYTYYQFFSGNYSEQKEKIMKYFEISKENLPLILRELNTKNFKIVCLNDVKSDIPFEELKFKINTKLNEIYPNQSIYEGNSPAIVKEPISIAPIEINKEDPIDFVFPYVTSEDPFWQKLYKKALGNDEQTWANGIERFRDNGMLKYLFRSLEKNLPWINKVHMIVMSESQIPSWLNREFVNIITHDEFIPIHLLPTFNSTTIEMFLPNINVSNRFIYSNDDLITFKKLPHSYFFKNNVPVYNINIRNFKETAPGDVIRRNCYNIILNSNQSNRVVTTQHGTISYIKEYLEEFYSNNKQKIIDSCSTFREGKNFNQYMYAFFQMMNKEIINSDKNIISYTAKPSQIKKILDDDFSKYDFVCINDYNDAKQEDWNKIIKKIDSYFPIKSKYEV